MDLVTLGTILIAMGAAIAIGVAIFSVSKSGSMKTRGGAVVIIGPLQIIFGSDKQSAKVLLLLSIVLVGVLIVLFLLHGL